MSITTWEDSGINWEEPQLADSYSALESIRLALLERKSVIDSRDIDHVINWPDISNPITRLEPIFPCINNLHGVVTRLFLFFVDHTDNNGDWSGLQGPANCDAELLGVYGIPIFTESKILSIIGDSQLYTVNKLNSIGLWIKQIYKIINTLKWSYVGDRHIYSGRPVLSGWQTTVLRQYVKFYVSRSSVSEIGSIPDFNYWYETDSWHRNDVFKTTNSVYVGQQQGYNIKVSYNFSGMALYPILNYYIRACRYQAVDNYFDGFPAPESSLYLFANKEYTPDTVSEIESFFVPAENYPYNYGYNMIDYLVPVLKFDGPNGFKFRAPQN